MGGPGYPPCWLFGLRQPNTGAYLGSLVGLMADSGGAHAKEYFPELLLPVSLSPQWATATPASAGDPPTLAGRFGSVSSGVTAPSPGSRYAHYFVCALQVWSLFTPVLSKSCNQIPLAFKVWFSRNSSSHCRTPRLGSLMWGSEPSLLWVDFCGISVLQSVFTHPAVMGFEFTVIAPLLPSLWLLLCLWIWSIFLVSSSVFLSMIVHQLVVILVFLQEGVRARPSTPLCWFRFFSPLSFFPRDIDFF